jgi:hypothetical protein
LFKKGIDKHYGIARTFGGNNFFFNVPFIQKFMVEIGQTYCFNPPSILIYLSKEKWQK